MNCFLLLAIVVAFAHADDTTVNINNFASGGGAGMTAPTMAGDDDFCGVPKSEARLAFYYAESLPFTDWEVGTGKTFGVAIQLFQAVCDELAVDCVFVRDEWTNIWKVESHCTGTDCTDVEGPGQGIISGWYDFALGWQKPIRMASLGFSEPLFASAPHILIAKKGHAGTVGVDGVNEKMAVRCGFGDISYLGAKWPMAELLKAEGKCSPSNDAQLSGVLAGTATMAGMKAEDWVHVAKQTLPGADATNEERFVKLKDGEGKDEWFLTPSRAVMTAKTNKCKTAMFNKAWKAIQKNGVLGRLCTAEARCCGTPGTTCSVDYNGWMNGV